MKKEYEIGDDILKIIQETLYQLYTGRIDFLGPDPKQEVYIETGLAGIIQVTTAIRKMAIRSGLVVNASDIEHIGTKEGGELYTSYTIPFLANVKFTVNPKFDPIQDEGAINPYIKGFRLSSYTYNVKHSIPELEPITIIATGVAKTLPIREYIGSELDKLKQAILDLSEYVETKL